MFGIEVRLVSSLRAAHERDRQNAVADAWRMLRHFKIGTVLDIGANEGQFAAMLRKLCPESKIYSFEPLPAVFETLSANFADDPSTMTFNLALSDKPGSAQMYCSDFTPSSSLLPMGDMHRDEWPESAENKLVSIELQRLDDWAEERKLAIEGEMLVKIDVQGHEAAVISGGRATLRNAALAVVEVSFYPLYDGQPLFSHIHKMLADLGFIYRGNIEQHYSRKLDKILFADAVFENVRRDTRDV